MAFAASESAKVLARPMLGAARPLFESSAAMLAGYTATTRRIRVHWFKSWEKALDEALEALPAPPGVTRDQYRELLQPTEFPKRHALITRQDRPIALISLRRRPRFWEPVAYQCLPGYVAPATDPSALRDAMSVLGLRIEVTGIGEDANLLGTQHVWPYEAAIVDLASDYQAHWNLGRNKQIAVIKRARRRCEHMRLCVDQEGDLEWVVNLWREMWKNDPEGEWVAAPDRIRFWKSLSTSAHDENALRVHVFVLRDGDRPAAGYVHTRMGGNLAFQCTARDSDFDSQGAGTAALEQSIHWAAAQGCRSLYLGSGEYKRKWAPISGKRNAVAFRPGPLGVLASIEARLDRQAPSEGQQAQQSIPWIANPGLAFFGCGDYAPEGIECVATAQRWLAPILNY